MSKRTAEPNFDLLHEWLQEFNETDGTLCPLTHSEIVWVVNACSELAEYKQAVRDLRAALLSTHSFGPIVEDALAATAHLVAEEK